MDRKKSNSSVSNPLLDNQSNVETLVNLFGLDESSVYSLVVLLGKISVNATTNSQLISASELKRFVTAKEDYILSPLKVK